MSFRTRVSSCFGCPLLAFIYAIELFVFFCRSGFNISESGSSLNKRRRADAVSSLRFQARLRFSRLFPFCLYLFCIFPPPGLVVVFRVHEDFPFRFALRCIPRSICRSIVDGFVLFVLFSKTRDLPSSRYF